jgi:hypothetical protein
MKKIIINIIISVLAILLILSRFIDFTTIFKSTNTQKVVSCVEYKSNINLLKPLVTNVNNYKIYRLKELDLNCKNIRIIKIEGNNKTSPSASVIWSFYKELINSKTIKLSLPSFIDKYLKTTIGEKNCEKISNEIKSWINHPQMTPDVKKQLITAFS